MAPVHAAGGTKYHAPLGRAESVVGQGGQVRQALGARLRALALGVSSAGLAGLCFLPSPLEQYLQTVQFDEAKAHAIAGFSIVPGVVVCALLWRWQAGCILLILSGAFAGARATLGRSVAGLVLVADLGLANRRGSFIGTTRQSMPATRSLIVLREKP